MTHTATEKDEIIRWYIRISDTAKIGANSIRI